MLKRWCGNVYYIDTSVLLENIPLVEFIKTTSGTRVVYFPYSHTWVYRWRNFGSFPLLFFRCLFVYIIKWTWKCNTYPRMSVMSASNIQSVICMITFVFFITSKESILLFDTKDIQVFLVFYYYYYLSKQNILVEC